MKITSTEAEFDALLSLAKRLCAAARTAPKACGIDNTDTLILTGKEKAELAQEMRKLGAEHGSSGAFFISNADNVDAAQVLVLFGITYETRGLATKCQLCGFENCSACEAAGAACVHAGIDLGIALGSAVAMAAREHVDNRIFFTAGQAARSLGLLDKHRLIMGLPLYCGGKSVFFDRKPA